MSSTETEEEVEPYLPISIEPSESILFEGSDLTESFQSSIIKPINLTDITSEYTLSASNGKSVPKTVVVNEVDNGLQLEWSSDLTELFPMNLIQYLYEYEQNYCFKWTDVPPGAVLIKALFNEVTTCTITLSVTFKGKKVPNPDYEESPIDSEIDSEGEISQDYQVILSHSNENDRIMMLKVINSATAQYNSK